MKLQLVDWFYKRFFLWTDFPVCLEFYLNKLLGFSCARALAKVSKQDASLHHRRLDPHQQLPPS